ncbi:MAG: N-formylglutamate amidohydrolase [Pseudomonadota bacterium]
MSDAAEDWTAEPAVAVVEPSGPRTPLVVCSPHSGRAYPDAFVAATRLDPQSLRRSEDSFVDELFGDAPACGAAFLTALFPRAYVDVNREAMELDPAMFADPLPRGANTTSPRVAAGLGAVPRVVAQGEPIYDHKIAFADARSRIETCWRPYHAALRQLIDAARDDFGVCVVLDAHSMPSAAGARRLPDAVLGDRHGRSCAGVITDATEAAFTAAGWRAARNTPYAGGYVTTAYGEPSAGVHVLQVEINRGRYMDEPALRKTAGFSHVQAVATSVIDAAARASVALAERTKKRGRARAARV